MHIITKRERERDKLQDSNNDKERNTLKGRRGSAEKKCNNMTKVATKTQ